MCPEYKDEESIFYAVLDIKSPSERAAYLEKVCDSNKDLLARIKALLEVHNTEYSFVEATAPHLTITPEEEYLSEGSGTIIGRYKLLEKIGEGGMAVVYMAGQERPIRRKVALKIIKLGMDTKSVIARFEAERQALAMMDHPNIAKVLDAGATETGRPYFVMELVKGTSITEYCDNNKLSTKDRLELFIQVCHAIKHAHENGIIHRDIKPSNVMVTLQDGQPTPKVIDFGIAKATSQRLTEKTLFTRYAQMIGTPAYMSPEQAELGDSEIDMRTDIYSLGILLYEMLTGTTPFAEEDLRKAGYLEMQRIICADVPVKPSTKLSTLEDKLTDIAERRKVAPEVLRKLIRGDLDWIVMKALEKDRTRRYERVYELVLDIERYLNKEPVSAGPPSAGYRLHKFVLHHRVAVVIASLVTGATLMGATAAKLGIFVLPGSPGKPEHAEKMVQRHVWNVPPSASLTGGISPDGRYLSYVDWTAGNQAARDLFNEISWLVTKNTDFTWKTIDGWADNSVVSPDGKLVAYSWYNQQGVNFYDLRIINMDGSNMRVLYHDASIFYILPYAWSPNHRDILAYFSEADKSLVDERTGELFRKAYLVLVSVADGSHRILKNLYKKTIPKRAIFSPDGQYVAYEFGQEDDLTRSDIYLIELESGQEKVLIEHPADDRLFGWTPDGQNIVFASDRTSDSGLWMINVTEGKPQGSAKLLKGEFKGYPIGFTEDGSFYYSINTTAHNVYIAKLNSTGVEFENQPQLTSSRFIGYTNASEWSPDGRFLIYRAIDSKSGDLIFIIYSVETSEERVIKPSQSFLRPDSSMYETRWSPDGQSLLVYGIGQENGRGLYTVDVDTGIVTLIDSDHVGFQKKAVWSPDGKSIYTQSWKSLSRLDPITGLESEIYQVKGKEETRGLDISPDGNWLAFYRDIDSLAVMPSTGGETREVVHLEQIDMKLDCMFVTWTTDGQHLLFGKRMNELWKVNVQTGVQQQIMVVNGDLLRTTIHPDGRQITFTVRQAGSQLWVMENFLPKHQSE